jgi:hypothetical protein
MALSSGVCLRLMPFWYNPCNQRYYEPYSYKIDPYCLPSSVYPTIVYDGGLFVSLHRGEALSISKQYPPGTRVVEPSSSNNDVLRSGTVVDIPMDPTLSPQYLIQFNNGTTKSIPASKMASFIPKPRVSPSVISFLPSFLLTPRSHLSTRVSTIKVTYLKPRTVPTASVTSRTSTRNNPTGWFPYPISHLIGKTCA